MRRFYEEVIYGDHIPANKVSIVDETFQKYDEAYFQDRDLIVVGSKEAYVALEKVEMPDAKTLCVQTVKTHFVSDEGEWSWDWNIVDEPDYERLLVELNTKLPEDLDIYWISKYEQILHKTSGNYDQLIYDGSCEVYSVRFSGRRMSGLRSQEDADRLVALTTLGTPPGMGTQDIPNGEAVAFQALPLPVAQAGENPRARVQVIRSVQEAESEIAALAELGGWTQIERQAAGQLLQAYDGAYFENGTLLLVMEPICGDYDSCHVELLERLPNGNLKVQVHNRIVTDQINYREWEDTHAWMCFLIALDQVLPEETQIHYVDHQEKSLTPVFTPEIYQEAYPGQIPVYTESFSECYFGERP